MWAEKTFLLRKGLVLSVLNDTELGIREVQDPKIND